MSQKTNPDASQKIKQALDKIDPEDRDVWLQVGIALKSELGEKGFSLWDQWSIKSEKYKSYESNKKLWLSFKEGGDLTIATLYHYAKQN